MFPRGYLPVGTSSAPRGVPDWHENCMGTVGISPWGGRPPGDMVIEYVGFWGDPPGATGEDREISIYFTHLEIRSIFQDTLLEQIAPEAP